MSCPAAVWLMDDLFFAIHCRSKPTSFPGLCPSCPYGERRVGENPGNEVEPKLGSRKGRENRGAILQLSYLLDPAGLFINTAFQTRPDWVSLSKGQKKGKRIAIE